MGWKFWENSKKSREEQSLILLREEVSQINKRFVRIEEFLEAFGNGLESVNQQLKANEGEIQKSLRLEYRSSQEMLRNLNQANKKMDEAIDYKERHMKAKEEIQKLSKEKNLILQQNIQWLDDIDLICDKITGTEREYWIRLLESWQKQIIKLLETFKIYEINVLGKTFNHELAEAIGTKKKEINKDYLNYEVVNVLQRGFVFEDGTLLRKAKVITIEEEESVEDYGE